jgi:hypothetical protein
MNFNYNLFLSLIVINQFKKMLHKLKFPALFLIVVLILSCNHTPKVKELKKTSESTYVTPVNTITDDLVSFISGIPGNKSECFSKLDSMVKWNHYARELDNMFSHANSFRFKKMKIWADSEIIRNQSITTVFYPFSGPDFLNANIFYPDADQYIMIGMEPIGYLPDICNMPPESVNSYLNTVNNALKDIFKRSYFITSRMNNDLTKTKINGTIPLLSLFIKRTGHQIVSIQRIGVDSAGKWQISDSLKNKKNIAPGIKVDFLSLSKKKMQSVLYFRTDISDKGLAKNPGFKIYLSELPNSYSYLKAASYLMHSDNFKIIRSVIFDISSTILQDDSGIGYKYFDKMKWNIKLYGKYSKPKNEFSYISEPDLQKAYKSSIYRPLPYSLGYNWGTDHTSLLYAIKK